MTSQVPRPAGGSIVRADAAATALFGVTAVYAASTFTTTAQWVGAVTAMSLFAIGVIAFMWSFWIALQLSRTEQLTVAEVYLLMGPPTPTDIARKMNMMIVVQFAIALGTSLWRPNGPNGAPGSSLVVGFLVPMLGFGLNGVWAARYGKFPPRTDPDTISTTSDHEIRQNAKHG